ncbi:hypothetical protein KB206_10620 [Microvirga sp. STS02]|nr:MULTISPECIES: hypothetical protein [Bacteria]MBH8569339.1 hypothetical protein [Hymenobacter negativus]MBR7209073.1 hypothetical protein [Microvirga sp. STS02]
MNLDAFRSLSDEVQLVYVYRAGSYIARRWDDVQQAVMLYWCLAASSSN